MLKKKVDTLWYRQEHILKNACSAKSNDVIRVRRHWLMFADVVTKIDRLPKTDSCCNHFLASVKLHCIFVLYFSVIFDRL